MTLVDDFLRGDYDEARRALGKAYAMGVAEGEKRAAERATANALESDDATVLHLVRDGSRPSDPRA